MKKISSLIMILLLLCNSIITVFPAKTSAKTLENVIKETYLTNSNGVRPSNGSFGDWETVRVNVEVELEDGSAKSGDTFSFYLPKELKLDKDIDFDIKDQDGNIIGKVHAEKQTKKVTVTFTDYVETHSNIKGKMYFNAKFDKDQIDDGEDHKLEFVDENGVIFTDEVNVHEGSFNNLDEKLHKYGYFDRNDKNLMHWVIRINVAGIDIKNAIVTDEIGSGHTLVKDSIKVLRVKFKVEDGKLKYDDLTDVTKAIPIDDSLPNKFTVNLGDIVDGYGYFVEYNTRIVGDGNASNDYSNKVTLLGNDEEFEKDSTTHKVTDGGGEGEGEEGSVEVMKVDSNDGHSLAGAKFDVIRLSDNKIVGHLTTDSKGKGSLGNLPFENYQLVETTAPNGYKLDQTPVKFTIDKTHKVIQLKIDNTLLKGSVVLTKVDTETKEKLTGAEFKLIDEQGKEIKENVVTDKEGKLVIEGLVPGNYQFIETKAPKGYVLDGTPLLFEIKAGETSKAVTVTKENKLETGSVVLNKVDASDQSKVLEGAEFKLVDDKGKEIKENVVTDKEGKLVVEGLVPGNYQFIETKAPKGYVLDETPLSFEVKIGEISKAVTVTKENKLETGSVVLNKVDASDHSKALEGAEFKLVDNKGNVIEENVVTDKEGKLVVEGLVPGNYQFIETKAPKGYELDETPLVFEIKGGETSKAVTVMKENKLIKKDPTIPVKPEDDQKKPSEELPHTGRAATNYLLIVVGGSLIVLAGLLLYRKRKIHR
ncbi:SpaA isopeptide-forming pilin-related protein [Bacillus cereus group sp. BfR-BA-01310]|uniref:SpaA isopeptide-forming pilin-related protein n=1 Tax=Bacillus cereus group sp. BfR-BA-01310 TaxID=2920287 RepID=UPI001F567B03|nr:SpaA isopeptide-forming pilin-related protein [Bacillus cereus group sp. BfR-BA-01310]